MRWPNWPWSKAKPEKLPYYTLEQLFEIVEKWDSTTAEQMAGCRKLYEANKDRMHQARGSTWNHHDWQGGYIDHVVEVMNIAVILHRSLIGTGRSSWKCGLGDALAVLFLHDLEKVWKHTDDAVDLSTKEKRHQFRLDKIAEYGIELCPDQLNALRYIEGEGDDYSNRGRTMNELAASCHMCDVASSRIWYTQPTIRGEW